MSFPGRHPGAVGYIKSCRHPGLTKQGAKTMEEHDKYVRRRWLYGLSAAFSILSTFVSLKIDLGFFATLVWLIGTLFWLSCFHLSGRLERGEWE